MEPLVCPLLNIVVNIKTSEKDDSEKMTQQWMQAGNKMQVPKETSRYHQEEFSFKGGSHPDNLIPTFFLASPISGTTFL
jgi:hypothetical protein